MSLDALDTAGAQHRRYEALQAGLDLIDQGFTLIDAQLRIVAWNEAFVRLLDLPRAQVTLGTPFVDLIRIAAARGDYGLGDVEHRIQARLRTIAEGLPEDLEMARANGQVLRVRGVPVPGIGYVTLYSDITARKAAEQQIRAHAAELEARVAERTAELRRSEQQMRLITDSIPALVAYVDHTRTYRYVNRGYQAWFGLDPAHPEVISARKFLGSETFASIRPFVARAFAGDAVSFEYELDRIDGSRIRVRTSLIPDHGSDGKVAGCFELTFDTTELRRAQALVLRAQKMDALGQLTGGLAHDFNNLLTVIVGNLALLTEEDTPSDPGEVRACIEPALLAARRGVALIRRLLTFARQQPLKSQSVDASQALRNVARLVRRSLPDTLQLEVTGTPHALWTWVDPAELEAALINLLLNARDATAGQGRVHLHIDAHPLSTEAASALGLSAGRYVCLQVSDDGCGMDAATQARLFEPFFTTKPMGAGTGLGMAMVYGFVTQSGGAIEVDSAPHQGTTLRLWLPATEAPPPPPQARPAERPAAVGTHRLALLVEDDAAVRRVVRHNLIRLGYVVLEAEHGGEAQQILQATPGIALVLTDVVMPGGVDGRSLAREARDRYHVPQVLLMSGHAPGPTDPDDLPLLAKPFSTDQLAAALAPPIR